MKKIFYFIWFYHEFNESVYIGEKNQSCSQRIFTVNSWIWRKVGM